MYTIMKRQTIERRDKPTSRNEWKLRYTIDKGFAETYLKYQYDMEIRNLKFFNRFYRKDHWMVCYQVDKDTIVLDEGYLK